MIMIINPLFKILKLKYFINSIIYKILCIIIMNIIDIVLIIIIFYLIFLLIKNTMFQKNETEGLKNESYVPIREKPYKNDTDVNIGNNVINDVINWDYDDSNSLKTNVTKDNINPFMLDIQFHNDYRDTITAFNNIVPDKIQLFNLANIPLHYSNPPKNEVKELVKQFIDNVNNNLKDQVSTARNYNTGWDEAIPDPNMKSGWTKSQEALGIQSALYHDPAPKNFVKLIDITNIEKYETEDEIKYAISMVLQKYGVDDQIAIKVSLVQDKRPMLDENNFYKNTYVEMKIVIEDIYILGFLSKYGTNMENIDDNEKEKFYMFDKFEKNDVTDPKYILKVLNEKYDQRNKEMNNMTAMLDEEGQNFHKDLPTIYDFSNVRETRTIYDDFNTKKIFI